jgi:N-acyl-D-amino-acid deacylase
MKTEIEIRNGTVIDGTGKPPFKADILISQGRILDIGQCPRGDAERIIDASSKVVAPGWVDIHTHADFTLLTNPPADSFVQQGTTTAVIGNCGFSLAPIRDKFKRELEQYIEPFTYGVGFSSDWHDYPEFLKLLEERGLGLNVAPLVGHGSLRVAVMGFDRRDPSRDEMNEMKEILDRYMEEGAVGLSTGLTYPPGSFSKTNEIVELCTVVARHKGIYTSHTRGVAHEGIEEAIQIGEMAKVPVHISHMGRPESFKPIEEARKRGLDATFDLYPYTAGSSYLASRLPGWVHEGGLENLLKKIKEPENRDRIKRDLEGKFNWNYTLIAYIESEKIKNYQGKTIQQLADISKRHPIDVLCNILIESNGHASHITLQQWAEESVKAAFTHPAMMVGSDGWPVSARKPFNEGLVHPRCYGTYPKVLGRYVRENRLLSLESAVHKMTALPAKKVGFTDRGTLERQKRADIVIFDPNKILDTATFEVPHSYPMGVEYVIVNGQLTVERGRHTGKLSGKVLLRKLA